MPITQEQAIAELNRRGVETPSDSLIQKPSINKQAAVAELQRRGISLPSIAIQPEPILTEAQRREKAGLVPTEQERLAIERPTLFAGREALRETGEAVAGAARKVGEFVGLEKAVEPLARTAARVTVPEEIREAIPEPTVGELVGGGLQIGALFIPYGQLTKALQVGFKGLAPKAISSALAAAGAGAVGGFALEAGEKIQRGEAPIPGVTTAVAAALPIGLKLTAETIKRIKPQQFAERLFESAAKVSTTLKPEKRSRVVKAALDEGIVPTKAGLAKTKSLINKYTNKVDDIIEKGIVTGRGKEDIIQTDDILTRLDDVRDFYGNTYLGDDFIDDINKVATKFKDSFGDQITVKQAQEIKRNTQQVLRKSFGELRGAQVEAGKNIARGIREELENVFPEIGKLNQKAKALIELNKELERAVGRISNRNLFGLTGKMFAAAGIAKEAPGVGLLLALTESIIGNPRVKARLAIALSKVGGRRTTKEIAEAVKTATKTRFPGDIAVESLTRK